MIAEQKQNNLKLEAGLHLFNCLKKNARKRKNFLKLSWLCL